MCGKCSRGCSRPNGRKNSRSLAALNGSLEAPSSPVYTEANAVQMIRMVITPAPGPPHTCLSRSLPIEVDGQGERGAQAGPEQAVAQGERAGREGEGQMRAEV